MREIIGELFRDMPGEFWPAMGHVLWRLDPSDPLALGYCVLNLLEAAAWFVVAGWVVRRHYRRGGGAWDWAYAAAFVLFGASDVVESQIVPVWLIAAKGILFATILVLRAIVIRRYYPGARM